METKRKKFQGALNILSFNRHFYIIGLTLLMFLIMIKIKFGFPDYIFWIIFTGFIYGLMMPLIVSAYVYDFSGYYNFDWLNNCNTSSLGSKEIININAGFDETSFILKKNFPNSNLSVFDFYNPKQHTETAIKRARKVSFTYPNTKQIKSDTIPLEDKSVDIIFLLSATHEIRRFDEKISFLKECHRVCKTDGKVIMVEHLRDLPNFMAFTVGFTHFFSREVWKKGFKKAGFSSFKESKFTPFISIFQYTP